MCLALISSHFASSSGETLGFTSCRFPAKMEQPLRPRKPFTIRSTLSPSAFTLRAAWAPAAPPPITTTSVSIVLGMFPLKARLESEPARSMTPKCTSDQDEHHELRKTPGGCGKPLCEPLAPGAVTEITEFPHRSRGR